MHHSAHPAPDAAVSDDGAPAPATGPAAAANALAAAVALVVVVAVRVALEPVSNSSMDVSIVPGSNDTCEYSWAVRRPEQRDLETMRCGWLGWAVGRVFDAERTFDYHWCE